MRNNNMYTGPFKDHLYHYVQLKRACGYKYKTTATYLKHFDNLTTIKYHKATSLTKEIVFEWCKKKSYETRISKPRVSVIRGFGQYLESIGVKAYILPRGYYPSRKKYVPYIYSLDELGRFFDETDKCFFMKECPYRHLVMPVIFRMIYTCGLRVSEARLLKVSDVDLERGVLTIHCSKGDKSRLIPMSTSLTKRCRAFSKEAHFHSAPEQYYFPGLHNKPITITNMYHNFRRFLWRAKIPHGGPGCGPRIHDFRHTYAVHCLKKWTDQAKDLTAYLPVLKTYLGHDSFAETAYYLHLTIDLFPNITKKLSSKYSDIIPELKGEVS